MRERTFCVSSLTKFSTELDGILDAVETYWHNEYNTILSGPSSVQRTEPNFGDLVIYK